MSHSITKFMLHHGCAVFIATTLALFANTSSAQCVYGSTPWPTQIQFVPANPVAGDPIRMDLGPMTLLIFGGTGVRQGQEILVTGEPFFFGGVPPAPHINSVTIGSLPAGNYSVRIQLRQGTTMCPEIVVPLGVAPISTPVPALADRFWQGGLVTGLLALALAFRNRRRLLKL